ncbi:hypothetical protein [Acetobacterium wieringae]
MNYSQAFWDLLKKVLHNVHIICYLSKRPPVK